MTIEEAQRDLRRACVGGGPGVLVSALTWIAAALVERAQGVGPAFTGLFFSGMLIYPLSTLASRSGFRRATEASDNPLGSGLIDVSVVI